MDPKSRVGLVGVVLLFAGCAYSVQWGTRQRSTVAAAEAKQLEPAARVARTEAKTPRAVVREPAEEAGCYAELRDAGVRFERVNQASAGGVSQPIKLVGPIDGVNIYGGGKKNAPTNYLDCRLALALLEWAPLLRASGVVGLHHYSMYRRAATVGQSAKVSGHAHGRAIDVAFFEMSDGRKLSVLDDWTHRARGAEPCEVASAARSGDRVMRELVCEATERALFQMVLTPHYNEAHRNHVHLEIDPRRDDSWIG